MYFSDRRNNRTPERPACQCPDAETGEYGWEDFVNPGGPTGGVPNNLLDTGEDVNGNGVLDTYGAFQLTTARCRRTTVPPGAAGASLDAAARPTTTLLAGQAQW